MTFVTEQEFCVYGVLVGDFRTQGGEVGNDHFSAADFNQTFAVQPSEVARNQFADSPQACGKFFVVFSQRKFDATGGIPAAFLRQPNQVSNQPPADGGK